MTAVLRMPLLLAILIFGVALFDIVGCSCPTGWVEAPSTCYKFVHKPELEWLQANGMCRDLGGTLAVLNDIQSNVWMQTYRVKYAEESSWIAGYKDNGQWYWQESFTSSPVHISYWDRGQPDNGAGRQNCMSLIGLTHVKHYKYATYRWDDEFCERKLPFICQTSK